MAEAILIGSKPAPAPETPDVAELRVVFDPQGQSASVQFNTEHFRTWSYVRAVLAAAKRVPCEPAEARHKKDGNHPTLYVEVAAKTCALRVFGHAGQFGNDDARRIAFELGEIEAEMQFQMTMAATMQQRAAQQMQAAQVRQALVRPRH